MNDLTRRTDQSLRALLVPVIGPPIEFQVSADTPPQVISMAHGHRRTRFHLAGVITNRVTVPPGVSERPEDGGSVACYLEVDSSPERSRG